MGNDSSAGFASPVLIICAVIGGLLGYPSVSKPLKQKKIGCEPHQPPAQKTYTQATNNTAIIINIAGIGRKQPLITVADRSRPNFLITARVMRSIHPRQTAEEDCLL
jgi:hypothetical protein